MTTITKERLQQVIDGDILFTDEQREMACMLLAGLEQEPKSKAAVATLDGHGFTWCGGEQWKPTLGLPPAFISSDREELDRYRKAAGKPVYQMRLLDGSREENVWVEVSKDEFLLPLKDPNEWDKRVLYNAPPVALKDHQIRELVNELRDIAIECHGTQQLRERIARTVRAAMIQGNSEPVQTVTRIECNFSQDDVEKLAATIREINSKPSEPQLMVAEPVKSVSFYRDGIEAAAKWVEQQRESYDNEHGWSDPDTGSFEFGNDAQRDYSDTLAEIAEGIRSLHPNAGNPPVIPDSWIKCSERMPEDDSVVLVADERGIVWCAEVQDGEIYPDEFPGVRGFGCAEAICWMPLPAAPQQEVNRE